MDIWWILQPPPVKRNYNGWEGVKAHPKNNPTQKKGTGRDGARAKKAQNQPTTTRGGTGGDGTGRDGTGRDGRHTYDDEERCCFLYVLLPHVVLFFLFALRFQQLYSRSFKTGTWCTCDTAITQKGPSPLHGTGRKSCVYRHNTWIGRWQCLFCNRSPYRSFSQN